MKISHLSLIQLQKLLNSSEKLNFATQHYPSRGQSAVQEIYKTKQGILFLKKVSNKNHENCCIDPKKGTLAERELWSYRLAEYLGLMVPELVLLDKYTSVQTWLNFPDAHIYSSREGKLVFSADNIFECALFDWLTGQIDRHDANYLYDYARKKIILIDSSFCFLKDDGSLPDYLKSFELGFSEELEKKRRSPILVRLKKISDDDFFKLVPLQTMEEQKALLRRKEQIHFAQNIQDIIDLYRGAKK